MSKITIACLGDIMCGDSFYNAGSGVASSLARHGADFLPRDIVNVLHSHDLVVGNIECVLSDKDRNNRLLRSVQMRGAGQAARYLAGWNLTVANVANNHILEHGHHVAIDTVDNLVASGIRVVGCGVDNRFNDGLRVERFQCRGQTFAFIGLCLRREKYAYHGGGDLDEVIEAVRSLSACDTFVCVSIHWGDEYMDYPHPEQISIADKLTQAGAGMIVGHHPHVVQGMEIRNRALVAYSMGNFIFDSFIDDCSWSVILSVQIVDGRLTHWRCLPVAKDHEHRPVLVSGRRNAALTYEFARRCEILKTLADTDEHQKSYTGDFHRKDTCARKHLRRHLLAKFHRMHPVYWPQILYRPIQRRLRIW